MTSDPLSFHEHTPIQKARALLKLLALDAAPIIDASGRLSGVVTAAACDEWEEFTLRSNPRRFAPEGLGWTAVSEIASPGVTSVRRTASVYEVIRTLVQHRVRRVYVVNEFDELVGVISAFDVLQRLSENGFKRHWR